MTPELPDGDYPFIDQRLPLSRLSMIEAPSELEKLLRAQAQLNGISIPRDVPMELRCQADAYPDATFLVYWPSGDDKLHMLAPSEFAKGRA